MKKILLGLVTFVFLGCGDSVSAGDTICGKTEKKIRADDVYGIGLYADYREQFEKETGCHTVLNCNAYIVIKEDIISKTFCNF